MSASTPAWNRKRQSLQRGVKAAVFLLLEHTGSAAFSLPFNLGPGDTSRRIHFGTDAEVRRELRGADCPACGGWSKPTGSEGGEWWVGHDAYHCVACEEAFVPGLKKPEGSAS